MSLSQLLWGNNESITINSLEELDRLVDKLEATARSSMSFSIQLSISDGTGLLLTIGREESHVEYYSSTNRPPVASSIGPWSEDDLIEFLHGGEPSEMEKRYFVPIEEARKALREYFQTGNKPTNIEWE